MLKPPFTRPLSLISSVNLPLDGSTPTSPTVLIRRTLPATIRNGKNIARVTDNLNAYYASELLTTRWDDIIETPLASRPP